jgi:hypothetical protein
LEETGFHLYIKGAGELFKKIGTPAQTALQSLRDFFKKIGMVLA